MLWTAIERWILPPHFRLSRVPQLDVIGDCRTGESQQHTLTYWPGELDAGRLQPSAAVLEKVRHDDRAIRDPERRARRAQMQAPIFVCDCLCASRRAYEHSQGQNLGLVGVDRSDELRGGRDAECGE